MDWRYRLWFVGLASVAVMWAGCTDPNACTSDFDCFEGQFCASGQCVERPDDGPDSDIADTTDQPEDTSVARDTGPQDDGGGGEDTASDPGEDTGGGMEDTAIGEPDVGEIHFDEVTAGERHSCGMLSDGRVVCWGAPERALEVPDERFLSIDAGGSVTCGQTEQDELVCWGWAAGPPSGKDAGGLEADLPASVTLHRAYGVSRVAADGSGKVCVAASTQAKTMHCYVPGARNDFEVVGSSGVVAISGGAGFGCLIDSNGVGCGSGSGSPPDGHDVFEPSTDPAFGIACGDRHCCTADYLGKIECFGKDYEPGGRTPPEGAYDQIVAGSGEYGCARDTTDKTVECWGISFLKVVGEVVSVEETPAADLAGGGAHACIVRESDGTIECWGEDGRGQASPPTLAEAVGMFQGE